ncbi:helix-turn-helix transcriptional regulator [Ruania zhangjianzhongii]|uniref:helix-turn-helix transcriptional regulator n=1 Tax=Ruania zhangjianzhongii TaxID=2603206 RepID=UPI00143D9D7D|nr:helix-turn-helix transcriptional regulator [Ruania zhangjianzhongii]
MAQVGSQIALVARTEELARLRELWQRCRTGSAAAVLLPGEAGVGKTRLVCEFSALAEADGGLVLTGHCVGLGEAAPPYLPVVEVLEQVRDVDPALLAEAPVLTNLVSRSGSERDTNQLQLFDAFLALLTALAEKRPVLLVVEDLHWADASTRDLLTFLLARMSDEALTVVLTYRSDELHRRHPLRPLVTELGRMRRVERLTLEPFEPQDARDFIGALARLEGEAVAESLVAEIAERSEGNAFFAEELFADGGGSAMAGPLADVLLGRIERLGADAQRVVRVASVAGQSRVRHSTMLAVTGLDEDTLEPALRECVHHYVLVVAPDETYEFRHSLLREAVYADLLPGERRRVHAAFVDLLGRAQNSGWRGAQAHHATEANDLPTALLARIGAAADAQQVGATADVLHHLEGALALWEAVPDAAELTGTGELALMIRAADAAVAAGRTERARAFLSSALELADAGTDPVVQAAVRRRLAKVHYADDDLDGGLPWIAQAWELIRDTPPSAERAWVLATRALEEVLGNRADVAEEAIADARAVGEAGAEADALISLSFHRLRSGDHEGAIEVLDCARARAQETGAFEVELRAYFNLTIGEFEAGRVSVAAEHVRRGLQRAREEGLVWATYGRELAWMAVQVLYAQGSWDEVAELASPPGEQAPDWLSIVLHASAAMLAASRGQWEQVEMRLRSDVLRRHDGEPAKVLAYAIAEVGTWQHRGRETTDQLERMIAEVRASEDSVPMSLLRIGALGISLAADTAARARQVGQTEAEQEARAAADRFAAQVADAREHSTTRAQDWGPEARAWLSRAHAEETRARGEQDVAAWTAVVDAFGYGDVYQRAIGQYRLAEALLAHGRTEPGDAALTEALTTARQLGAQPLTGALESVARRYRRPVAGVRMVSADVLTPRERSVLELVARGLTNRGVGAELFISEKTVSVHLSRAMAKLGAHSRTEAVALALRDGLIDT